MGVSVSLAMCVVVFLSFLGMNKSNNFLNYAAIRGCGSLCAVVSGAARSCIRLGNMRLSGRKGLPMRGFCFVAPAVAQGYAENDYLYRS